MSPILYPSSVIMSLCSNIRELLGAIKIASCLKFSLACKAIGMS